MLLELRTLGVMSIHLDGAPLAALKSQKGRALLCYLAVTNREQSRAALAGLFWPEMPESRARANLRKVVGQLNTCLPAHFAASRRFLALDPGSTWWLDVDAFAQANDAIAAPSRLQEAVSLYQGDFLEGFELPDAPPFDAWVLAQRARLRAKALRMLQTLISHFSLRGNFAQAADYARHLLVIEPWHEETHRELMRLLALSGQRSAALMQYEQCKQILQEELDVAPAPETEAIVHAIRRGEALHTWLAAAPTARGRRSLSVQRPISNLPAPATPFVGREEEMARLVALFLNPGVRLVTLLGIGGIGKTRLALAFAHRQINHYRDGAWFVSLEALDDVARIVPAIAQAVGFAFYEAQAPLQQLLRYLQNKQILLVIDNCEHLVHGMEIVSALLQGAPQLRVLATSRQKLNLQGEHLFRVDGLDFPEGSSGDRGALPARASTFAAVQLFAQGVLRSRPGYAFTAQDWAHMVQICRLTAGMPLAIAIASAWAEWLSLGTIVEQIRASLDFLEVDLLDVPHRHRSMQALFDTSWRLLGEHERIIFARLCIFHGGFTVAAAEAVAGAALADLRSLANKSMIQPDGQGRFAIHELLRKYGAARLAATPAGEETTRDRHSAYYCAALRQQETAWLHGEEVAAFRAIEQEFENHRAAWQWAVARGAYARLLGAIDTVAEFYCWQSWYREGEAIFARLHGELEKYDAETTTLPEAALRVYLRALIWQARFNQEFLGHPGRAEEQLQKGADLLETMASSGFDTRGEHAFLLMRLARLVAHQQGDRSVAQLRERSLELFLESGDSFRAGLVSAELGWAALQTAGHSEARRHFETGLTIFTALNHTLYRASVLCGLAAVAGLQGHFMESEKLLGKAIASSSKRGVVEKVVSPHLWLGSVLRYQGKYAASETVLQEGIERYTEAGWIVAACNLHSNQAVAKMHLGDYHAARRQSKAVCQSLYAHGRESSTVWGLIVLGMVSLAEGSWVEAQECLHESLAMFARWQQKTDIGKVSSLLALAQHALGHHDEAEKALRRAIELSLEIRGYPMPLHVLPVVALRRADAGNVLDAVALYALASRYPMVAHSAWYRDVFGQPIERAAAALPGEQIAEATRRGRAQDVWKAMADLAAV